MGRSPISGIPDEEYVEDPLAYIANEAKVLLPLACWGFAESYRRFKSYFNAKLIYDSDMCRIRIGWGWERESGNQIAISYGRLHAPNDEITMKWNGEICLAWHSPFRAFFFLDGVMTSRFVVHPIVDEFRKSEIFNKLAGKRDGRIGLAYHAFIWERYAPRLFELFDLRRPELWNQYREFLRVCYVAEGENEEDDYGPLPPYYRVC